MGDVQKVSGYMQVPSELLADGGFLVPDLFDPSLRTPSRHATEKAERKAARDKSRSAATARHLAATEAVATALVPVLDHHGPHVPQGWGYGKVYCEGCDAGSNAEDDAEWPCSTWLLITGETG